MRLALVVFEGLEDVVKEVSKLYSNLDVFFGPGFDASGYDAVILASRLGGRGGDELINELERNPAAFVFCTVPYSIGGMQVSRVQANRIIGVRNNFEGAIISDFLSLEEKLEVLKMILDAAESK